MTAKCHGARRRRGRARRFQTLQHDPKLPRRRTTFVAGPSPRHLIVQFGLLYLWTSISTVTAQSTQPNKTVPTGGTLQVGGYPHMRRLYLGPGELAQSSARDCVSSSRAFLSRVSLSLPGCRRDAFLRTSFAYRASRSLSDRNPSERRRAPSRNLFGFLFKCFNFAPELPKLHIVSVNELLRLFLGGLVTRAEKITDFLMCPSPPRKATMNGWRAWPTTWCTGTCRHFCKREQPGNTGGQGSDHDHPDCVHNRDRPGRKRSRHQPQPSGREHYRAEPHVLCRGGETDGIVSRTRAEGSDDPCPTTSRRHHCSLTA